MATNITIEYVSKFTSEIPQKLFLPITFFTDFLRKVLLHMFRSLTVIANSVAIFFCYLYLKNFRRHSMILVDGYVAIFKIFAEYMGSTACVCYGVLELDLNYLVLGSSCIFMGLGLKALMLYHQKIYHDQYTKFATHCVSVLYLACIFFCCSVFHDIASKMGALRCVTRIVTCVVPLVALSDSFRSSGSTYFSLCTDALAISALWWYCSHLSIKYFVVVPSIIGALFTFIRYVLEEIQKATSKEVETELYKR